MPLTRISARELIRLSQPSRPSQSDSPIPLLARQFPLNLAPRIIGRSRRVTAPFAIQDFNPSPAQLRTYAEFRTEGDPAADALAAEMKGPDATHLRSQFAQALSLGIDCVDRPSVALREFFESVERIPFWVDFDEVDRGARVMQTLGPLAAPLALLGLAATYVSPDGNAVMFRSGDTRYKAASRAVDTMVWIKNATTIGALRNNGSGFQATVHLRLTHAFIRSAMKERADWDHATDGLPINQQIYGTVVSVFALYPLAGPMGLGVVRSRRDRAAVFHMWRYIAHVMGVHPDMIPADESDAMRVLWMYLRNVGNPDWRAKEMGTALIAAYPKIYGFTTTRPSHRLARWVLLQAHTALAAMTLGRNYAASLGYASPTALGRLLAMTPFAIIQASSLLDFIPTVRERRLRLLRSATDSLTDRMVRSTRADGASAGGQR